MTFMKRALVLAVALVLLLVSPASAHVSANPSEVASGGFAVIAFRVPNETSDSTTTKVEIAFPEAAPFAFVSVKPKPGWTHTEQTVTLDTPVEAGGESITEAVSRVTWEGGQIAPGEFDEFEVSVGPVPDVDKLEFKALQTYDNGDVVRWIDPVVEGEDEPEHPAPTITVTAGDGDEHGGSGAAEADDDDDDGEDGTDTGTFIALAVGGLALVAALAALIMGRSRPPA
jgi:periplasmic copper chaperone A